MRQRPAVTVTHLLAAEDGPPLWRWLIWERRCSVCGRAPRMTRARRGLIRRLRQQWVSIAAVKCPEHGYQNLIGREVVGSQHNGMFPDEGDEVSTRETVNTNPGERIVVAALPDGRLLLRWEYAPVQWTTWIAGGVIALPAGRADALIAALRAVGEETE